MASSRLSYAGGDWTDVAATLVAFEGINNVRLELKLSVGDRRGQADLLMQLDAWERDPAGGEAKRLASVSAACSQMNLRTLEDALINLMYQVDARLADGEFLRTISK